MDAARREALSARDRLGVARRATGRPRHRSAGCPWRCPRRRRLHRAKHSAPCSCSANVAPNAMHDSKLSTTDSWSYHSSVWWRALLPGAHEDLDARPRAQYRSGRTRSAALTSRRTRCMTRSSRRRRTLVELPQLGLVAPSFPMGVGTRDSAPSRRPNGASSGRARTRTRKRLHGRERERGREQTTQPTFTGTVAATQHGEGAGISPRSAKAPKDGRCAETRLIPRCGPRMHKKIK